MHTVVFITKRVDGMTHDEFVAHYEQIHAPLARELPGLIEYRQLPIRRDYEWNGQPADYDAVSVYVFESDDAAAAAWASPAGVAVNEDTVKFMHWDSILAFPGTDTSVHQPAE
jgi:uncharacterized protein (TIGR02118 family)